MLNILKKMTKKKVRIAINGFGRIGRPCFKIAFEDDDVEVVAINDLTDKETLAHLLKYDSVFGIYEKEVECDGKNIKVSGKKIPVFSEPDPEKLPWKDLGVDIVFECTGFFTTTEKVSKHLKAGAKRVIISAPAKDKKIPMVCLGCNEDTLTKEDLIVSNSSCTTNCLAPVAKVLNDKFTINKALMTTIHSYTSTQNLVDAPSGDLRRARAAAVNTIPSTTGAAVAVTQVIPELEGKFDGMAVRVQTPCVSLIDLVVELDKSVTIKEVNQSFKDVAEQEMKGILSVEEKPLVSSDFIKNTNSSIVDAGYTNVVCGNLVKVLAWYDNEWGYSKRMVDLAKFVNEKIKN
jgi:glyceraldehyde 3-phosphate dehydrogenase